MWSRMDDGPDNDHHLEFYTAAGRVEAWILVSLVPLCTLSPSNICLLHTVIYYTSYTIVSINMLYNKDTIYFCYTISGII